jgi:hypothetical protein
MLIHIIRNANEVWDMAYVSEKEVISPTEW